MDCVPSVRVASGHCSEDRGTASEGSHCSQRSRVATTETQPDGGGLRRPVVPQISTNSQLRNLKDACNQYFKNRFRRTFCEEIQSH